MAQSVSYSPDLKTVRTVKVNDVALPTEKKYGINLADFDEVIVHAVLKNGATGATVTPYYWSPEAGKFIADAAGVTIVAAGANSAIRKIIRVGRCESVFFEVTAIAGGAGTDDRVSIELSGIPSYDKVG
jgi:hypothetical protein